MLARTLRTSILLAVLVAGLSAAAHAQTGILPPQDDPASGRGKDKPGPLGSPEEEMMKRAAIRHEEENHKEMVERAEEAAHIGDEILASFKKNNSLTRDDVKRLERLEKLARKIRGSAGGSDDDKELPDPPVRVESAIARLAELTGDLKKSVSKTSRLVISAAVIERSNEMIELIRHIRNIKQP